jgi:hypothetical protein
VRVESYRAVLGMRVLERGKQLAGRREHCLMALMVAWVFIFLRSG